MFSGIKQKFQKIYNQFTNKAKELFGYSVIDEQTLNELERLLISADTGVKTTRAIIAQLKKDVASGSIKQGQDLKNALSVQLESVLKPYEEDETSVYLLVGINGSGKTTCAGKLAHLLQGQGKKVLLVAADTFRAAAQEQLQQWAQKTGAAFESGQQGKDPASVVFTGMERFESGNFDAVIIDTAGRLQTKTNLMRELEKIKRVIERKAPQATLSTFLTIDTMLGQNSLEQARVFHESTKLDSIILTKMDGTGKGGIVFAIAQELNIPISYLSVGESLDDLERFDAQRYVNDILN